MLTKATRQGVSLLELVVVLAIIGLIVATTVPNFTKRRPSYLEKAFVTELNASMAQAWQQGLVTQKIQKIVFDAHNKKVFLEQEVSSTADSDEMTFQKVALPYVSTSVSIPETLEIRQFFVQGVDEFAGGASQRTTETVWFFVMPGGMAQEVVINMYARQDGVVGSDDKEISLVLNPFTAQFKTYDVFQSPA